MDKKIKKKERTCVFSKQTSTAYSWKYLIFFISTGFRAERSRKIKINEK